MKKIVLMLMMVVAAITANAQKYALVDMEYILKNVPAYERANEQLNQDYNMINIKKNITGIILLSFFATLTAVANERDSIYLEGKVLQTISHTDVAGAFVEVLDGKDSTLINSQIANIQYGTSDNQKNVSMYQINIPRKTGKLILRVSKEEYETTYVDISVNNIQKRAYKQEVPPIFLSRMKSVGLEDVTIQAKILDLIKDIQKKRNLSVIFITHNMGVVAKVADRINVMYAGKIVESGTADEIFYDPRHPYTWGLLSAMPDLNTTGKRLYTIPGSPPNLLHKLPGDPFAPRNAYALNIDDRLEPPMFKVSETHSAATWLLHPDAPKVELPAELKERIERMKEEANANGR